MTKDTITRIKREHYDKKLLTVFELVGSCLMNIYYNDLYIMATKDHNKKSITDEYITKITIFTEAIKKDRTNYKKIILRLHQYFIDKTKFALMTLQQFEDKYISSFIPEEYFETIDKKQKDNLLHKIFCSIISEFSALCVKKIRIIVDNRGNEAYVHMLQDALLDIHLKERETLIAKFLTAHKKEADTGIPIELYQKLKGKIVTLAKENCDIKTKYTELDGKYTIALQEYQKYKMMCNKYENPPFKGLLDVVNNFDYVKMEKLMASVYKIRDERQQESRFIPQQPMIINKDSDTKEGKVLKLKEDKKVEEFDDDNEIVDDIEDENILDEADIQEKLTQKNPPILFNPEDDEVSEDDSE